MFLKNVFYLIFVIRNSLHYKYLLSSEFLHIQLKKFITKLNVSVKVPKILIFIQVINYSENVKYLIKFTKLYVPRFENFFHFFLQTTSKLFRNKNSKHKMLTRKPFLTGMLMFVSKSRVIIRRIIEPVLK